MDITNLTKTKIDLSFLQKVARAAFAVLPRRSLAKQDEGGFASPKPRKMRSEGGFASPKPRKMQDEGRLGKGQDISLVLVSDKKIKELNKKYRGKNKVTDVLSFEELNEIFISLPQAKRQAARLHQGYGEAKLLKTSLKSELMRLLVHGIVHLNGYDHEQSKSAELEMREIEDEILKRIENQEL